jgi:hypothetical protein
MEEDFKHHVDILKVSLKFVSEYVENKTGNDFKISRDYIRLY